MAGKRPLVDRSVKGALLSWASNSLDIPFTAASFYEWMLKMDMIPNNCHGFNQRMIGNRLSFWSKAGKVPGLRLHKRHTSTAPQQYVMVRGWDAHLHGEEE